MTLVEMIEKRGGSRPATATSATPATQTGKTSPLVGSIPATPSLPPVSGGHCQECGGGYWIRPTIETPCQCGRCVPSETRMETLYVPGGTAPPKSLGTTKEQAPPIVQPATKPDGSPLSGIYWEAGDGLILGPAVPEFVAQDGDSFWVSITFEEAIRWINADRLRSKKAFDAQSLFRSRAQLGRDNNDTKGSNRTK